MTNATDAVIEASMSALEFTEAAWEADEDGRRCPDASDLSDLAILAVLKYPEVALPTGTNDVVVAEATRRGLVAGFLDRWLPWAVVGSIVLSGVAIVFQLMVA
ncbi:MAG: hypothetical protein OEW66_07100 [Actinomycetota bacterium]|nr:hypothetical protein [Actinomycetota bacterium]MDH5313593.1 hypothetical protein [Actinomycetota bacterium]